MADVTATHNVAGLLRVYINGVLHLAFSTRTMAGLQSWKMTTRAPPLFALELTFASAVVLAEYDHEDVWRAVLGAIDAACGQVRELADGKGARHG